MTQSLGEFKEIICLDFEYSQPDGENPLVVCLVAHETHSGRLHRLSAHQLYGHQPPFEINDDTLFVAYSADAEMQCFIELGWELPKRVLDLRVEFLNSNNGLKDSRKKGATTLLRCMEFYGLPTISVVEKEEMRRLAMKGGPYTEEERIALLNYCQTDVDALVKLLPKMIDSIVLSQALVRGRYMVSVAGIQHTGIPVDVDMLSMFRRHWENVKQDLVNEYESVYQFGIYDNTTFKQDRFVDYINRRQLVWPTTRTGRPKTDKETFDRLAEGDAELTALKELRHALSGLKLEGLVVGSDDRNRCNLNVFWSKTSRNQPSNTAFLFGPAVWLRGLIKPPEGQAVAYIDWSQQELGIAAALSGDQALKEAYLSGDPYLKFAKQAGAVPPDATKQSHPEERNLFKVCSLAVQYRMSEVGLARRLKCHEERAKNLLRLHRETYPRFWQWSEQLTMNSIISGRIVSRLGWQLHLNEKANHRSVSNYPMQCHGAEMLRLGIIEATRRGVPVAAPVHDAVMITGHENEIEELVAQTQAAMKWASEAVLLDFSLDTDSKIVRWPDRYFDERGRDMWDRVVRICKRRELAG